MHWNQWQAHISHVSQVFLTKNWSYGSDQVNPKLYLVYRVLIINWILIINKILINKILIVIINKILIILLSYMTYRVPDNITLYKLDTDYKFWSGTPAIVQRSNWINVM